MEANDNLMTNYAMNALREGIKAKYRAYTLTDPIQFPDFEYNTNRANYEPLRNSFEKEFYVVRGIDRSNPNIHIPSTNTLALIYTNDSYVPGRKIRNTCRSYAEGQTADSQPARPALIGSTAQKVPKRVGMALLAGLVAVIGLGAYFFVRERQNSPKADRLTIAPPAHAQAVSRLLPIEGGVANADTVWVVVRPAGSPDYYVQAPVRVDSSGHWRGLAVIGSTHKANGGVKFQIRAFVKPEQTLVPGDALNGWPKAELTSGITDVVRGDETIALPTDDLPIYAPLDGQMVPCSLTVEGKAANADTVWIVIRSESNARLWVQPPIKVEKNGRWKGTVYVGEPGMADVGWPYKIRAFVKPTERLKYDEVVYEWPKAERSSGVLYVVRGPMDK